MVRCRKIVKCISKRYKTRRDSTRSRVKKIFNTKSYDKSYVRSGLKQINDYTRDFNKEFGFLVIFNVSEKELSFNLKSGSNFISIGDKIIFFITINIANPETPASKRKKLDLYEIDENYLQELK